MRDFTENSGSARVLADTALTRFSGPSRVLYVIDHGDTPSCMDSSLTRTAPSHGVQKVGTAGAVGIMALSHKTKNTESYAHKRCMDTGAKGYRRRLLPGMAYAEKPGYTPYGQHATFNMPVSIFDLPGYAQQTG